MEERYEAAVQSVMCRPELPSMDSASPEKSKTVGKAAGCDVVLRPLIVPELEEELSETSSTHEADLGTQRRFELASGELTYFKPDVVSFPKPSTRSTENPIRSKSVSPKTCTSVRSHEENIKKSRRPESDLEQPKSMSKSLNLFTENSSRAAVKKVEGKGRSKPFERYSHPAAMPVSDDVVDSPLPGEDDRNTPTMKNAGSPNSSSLNDLEEGSTNDDDFSYPSTSLDSSCLCTPVDGLQDSPTTLNMDAYTSGKALPDTTGHNKSAKFKREVQVAVNSKRKFQHLVNSESASNSGTPNSREMSSTELSFLVEDTERDIAGDAEERRKSLIIAATAADVPKFKWGDLDVEDLEQMQVLPSGASNTDSISATPRTVCGDFASSYTVPDSQEDVSQDAGSDSQDLASPNVVREIQGFGSPDAERNVRTVTSSSQQTDFPGFAIPKSNTGEEVGGGVAPQISDLDLESLHDDEVEEPVMPLLNTGVAEGVTSASSEGHGMSGLALMTMGQVEFHVTPAVETLPSAKVRKKDAAGKADDLVDGSDKEAREMNTEGNQDASEHQADERHSESMGLGGPVRGALEEIESAAAVDSIVPGSGDGTSSADALKANEPAPRLELGNVEVHNPDALALVTVTTDASCGGPRADKEAGGEQGDCSNSFERQTLDSRKPDKVMMLEDREGKERFRLRLWCYLFENLNRAIDELYFLCELESDVDQIKEALLVLDEAGVDFKDLKARVDGFERVRKGPGLPRPSSAASSSSSISTKGRPHAIAWEVRRMACSQEHADMLSSSLEALKKVQGSPTSHSPQGRRGDTSHALSPDAEKVVLSEFMKLKESVAASRDVLASSSRETPPKIKEPVATTKSNMSKSKDVTPSRRDVPSKSKEVVSSIKELPAKVKDGLISKITPTKLKECQESGGLSKSLNLGPPHHADRGQAETPSASDTLSHQGPASSRASPREREGLRKKGALINDSELLTNRSIDSASKRSAPSSSPVDRFMSPTASSGQRAASSPIDRFMSPTASSGHRAASSPIDRFMSPTASSGHRAASREKEFNLPTSSKTALEAWKEKRNWEDILSSPLSSSSRISRSPGPGRKSTERVRVLHDKLMSPERKKKSPSETKKEVDGKQARATRIRMELENEKVQRLQRTTEKLNRVSEWQAVRSNKLRGGMHARQQRGESRHEAHLAQIARRASDESSKVSEVRFITSLNEENKKLSLQQKLQDSETRRAERLQSLRLKQKEDFAKEEAAQERRRQLEAERLQRIAEAQRRKEEAKARREEERKAASAAREARAVEHVRKKEAWAKAQQEEAELLGQKLSERLRESSLRRKMYLEQIRERALMDFDKQDKRSREILSESPVRMRDQGSPSGRRTSSREKVAPGQILEAEADRDVLLGRPAAGSRGQTGAGLISLVGTLDSSSVQTLKKRVKKIRQRLTSKKIDFPEPPFGAESHGIGTSTVTGGARSKIGRWMQELGRLQQMRKPGNLSTSRLIISEMVKYLEEKEPELHAARQQGLIDYIATALPASHSSKPEASTFTVALLRLLIVLLSLPANRSYFIARNLLPPLIPMVSTALENFSTSGYSINNQGAQPSGTPSNSKEISGTSKEGQGGSSCAVIKEEKMTPDEKLEVMQEVLEGLIWVVTTIIGHVCLDDHLMQMQEDLADLVVACEVLHRLRNLFALFDRPQIEGAAIPGPVLLGLKLLETLTGPRGKTLAAAHETPVNITGRPPQLTPDSDGAIREDTSTQKLGGVREEGPEGDSAVPALLGPEWLEEEKIEKPEGKTTDNGKKPDSAAATSLKPQADEKNQMTLSRSTKSLLEAIGETGLVGLPSLLTAVLLQANPRSSPEQAACALPSNFEEVATSVLRVLNNVARLDLPLVQNMLALPDLRMEFFHLVSFLLSHCTCKWKSTTDQVAALLMETLLLLGYAALLHPGNQAVLRWGKSPTILHKMCDLPFAFFSDPKLTPILIGTLLSVCYGSERNRDVVQQELSMDMLLAFLKNSRQEATPVPLSPAPDSRTEDEDASVKSKFKNLGSEPDSGNTTARSRPRPKHFPDVFFPSPKKPNRLLGKNAFNISITSSEGDSFFREPRSGATTYRSNSGRVTPVSDVQPMAAKRPKSGASMFPPSLPTRSLNPPQAQAVPTVPGLVAADTAAVLPITSAAALALQNRFPQSLWTYAEEFFSTGSWMGHIFKAM